ncbi:unnamed protein product [Parnassius apollo]|uniref:(apollo) hypothetical protein n=1 Tax=Parnassius apollo TaxID=110799 RepID=A0A8S3Y2F0_PARAO|nr:unnamed protein product [Parnassius apollo]
MQLHQIATQQPGTITYRDLGCFCGSQRGLCSCYEPKIHKFECPTTENRGIEAADTLDDIEPSDLMNVDVEINLEELSAMNDVNFSSIGDLTKSNETNSALENVDEDFSFIGDSSKPNTIKANSSMDEVNSCSNGNTGKPNISQGDSAMDDVDFLSVGKVKTQNNGDIVIEVVDNTKTAKDKMSVKESTVMDYLNISYTNSTADNKPNVFKTDLVNDIQMLDQNTTNDEIIVEETTVMERPHISPTHPADYTQTNAVSQADSFKENLSTMRKIPCIVDLTIHPLEMKLTYKPKKRSSSSVLCVSQPKVKKSIEEEINSKNNSKPCTSKSLRKSTVSILSNVSVDLKSKTEQTRLPKQSKGLKMIVKRAFTCYSCNGPLLSNCITKCIFCCNRFCLACATGEVTKDYICDNCLM